MNIGTTTLTNVYFDMILLTNIPNTDITSLKPRIRKRINLFTIYYGNCFGMTLRVRNIGYGEKVRTNNLHCTR